MGTNNKHCCNDLLAPRYKLQPVMDSIYIAEGQNLNFGSVVDCKGFLCDSTHLEPYAILYEDCDTTNGAHEANVLIMGEFNIEKLVFGADATGDVLDKIVFYAKKNGIIIRPYDYAPGFTPPEVSRIENVIPEGASEAVSQIDEKIIKYNSNLLTEDAVSLGTGWSGDIATGLVHSGSSTNPVTFSTSTTNNKPYLVKFTLSNDIQGKLGVSIGNKPLCDVYNGNTNVAVGIISDGGSLKITPLEANVSITITNLEFCEISEEGENELVVLVNNVSGDQMQKNLTGFWNVALDKTSLPDCENASRNVAIGHYALFKLVTGTRNVAIGTFALPWAKYANGNIAIGADTLYNTDSEGNYNPTRNVAIGFGAQKVGSSTTRNVSVGNSAAAGAPNDSANNVNIGTQAGNYAKTYNVNVGDRAGYYTKGSQNVSVGGGAGSELYITGDNNVALGYSAGPKDSSASSSNIVTMNNTLSLGTNARATKSNQIMIGSIAHTEIVVRGNIKLVFNDDGTVTWEELT